jgi:hypothetical protein
MRNVLGLLCLMVVATTITFSQIPTNGLVRYWPFNGNANDESGNGNNGTVNGATLIEDRFGNSNSAYRFGGVSSNILVNGSIDLQVGGKQTFLSGFFSL